MKKYIRYIFPLFLGLSLIEAMEPPPGHAPKHSLAEEDKAQTEGKRSRGERSRMMPEFNEKIEPYDQALLRAAAEGDLDSIRENIPANYFDRPDGYYPFGRAFIKDVKGRGLLCFAVLNRHIELFHYLLPQSPYDDIDSTEDDIWLDDSLLAALKADEEFASEFVNRLFPDDYASYKKLFIALLLDSEERIQEALDEVDFDVLGDESQRFRPLHAAVLLNSAIGIREILARGCPIDITNKDVHTALSYAVDNNRPKIVAALLEAGADANSSHPDPHGSCLCEAIEGGYAEVLELLLMHGGNANTVGQHGTTLLHFAVDYWRLHPECVLALLSHGALVNARDQGGETPLHHIVREVIRPEKRLHVIRMLLEHGAGINACVTAGYYTGKSVLSFALIDPDIHRDDLEAKIKIVQELLLWGARLIDSDDPRYIKSDTGRLEKLFHAKPLIFAVCSYTRLFSSVVNASCEALNEALMYAIAQQRDGGMIQFLIQLGAQPHTGLQFLDDIVLKRPLSPQSREAYERIRTILSRVPSLVSLIIRRENIHDLLVQDPRVTWLPAHLREGLLSSILFTGVQSRNIDRTQRALAAGADPAPVFPFMAGLTGHPEIVRLVTEKFRLRQDLLDALKAGDASKMQQALQAGARPGDLNGKPFLLHAAEFANAEQAFEMVKVLLAYVNPAGLLQQLDALRNRPEIAALIIERAREHGIAFVEPAWLVVWRMQGSINNQLPHID
jgi:ankyrin repeat protein